MSKEDPTPKTPLPEIRLKPGFKNPRNPSKPEVPGSHSSAALSIDEMLELTRGVSSTLPPEEPKAKIEGSIPSLPSVAPPKAPAPAQSHVSEPARPPQPVTHASPPPEMLDSPPVSAEPAPAPQGPGFLEETLLGATPTPPPPPASPQVQLAPGETVEIHRSSPRQRTGQDDRGFWYRLSHHPLATGLMLLGFLCLGYLAISPFFSRPVPFLIKSKPAGAEVLLNGVSLGETPLELEIQDLNNMPELRLAGYEAAVVPTIENPKTNDTNKVFLELKGQPIPLDWSNLSAETRVWWNGAELRPEKGRVGKNEIKIKPKGQSSFIWSHVVPWDDGQQYPIGAAIAKEIEKRPALSLSLTGANKAEVIVKSGAKFTQTITLSESTTLTLPAPGTYAVKVKKTGSHPSFERSLDLQGGQRKSVEVALARPKPSYRAAPRAAGPSYRQPSYSPQPSYQAPRYTPPAPYRRPNYSGGGGGAGTIAPPSF